MSTSASIYRGIKLVCVSLGKYYSFPFTSAAVITAAAIAAATATALAVVRA